MPKKSAVSGRISENPSHLGISIRAFAPWPEAVKGDIFRISKCNRATICIFASTGRLATISCSPPALEHLSSRYSGKETPDFMTPDDSSTYPFDLSIILVSFNTREVLRESLQSIEREIRDIRIGRDNRHAARPENDRFLDRGDCQMGLMRLRSNGYALLRRPEAVS